MEKQFNKFRAIVPDNFKNLMIDYWMDNEKISREAAINFYIDDGFNELSERISDNTAYFNPDLGYTDKEIDGQLCFEAQDNNFVIPVNILKSIK